MVSTCGDIGSADVVRVLDFPAGIVGVNGYVRFLLLEESFSDDEKRHPAVSASHTLQSTGCEYSN